MNVQNYTDFLLTRILQRNDFGTIEALVSAINKASAMSESEQWRERKAAFNAIAERAPLRTDVPNFCVIHADIPAFLRVEYNELTTFSQMTKRKIGPSYRAALAQFWVVSGEPG